MKKKIWLLAILLCPMAVLADAVLICTNNVPIQSTNAATATTTVSTNVFEVGRAVAANVCFWVSANNGATTNVAPGQPLIVNLQASYDGLNFTTNRAAGMFATLLPNGTNVITVCLNPNTGGARYFKVGDLECLAGGQATNFWTNITVTASTTR